MEIRKCGAIKITKNTDIDKCASSGYETGFDRHGSFSFPGTRLGRNGVDMSSSKKIDNRKKDILILGKGPTQGLEHTLSAKKMYSINSIEIISGKIQTSRDQKLNLLFLQRYN